ncbi:HET-domain-containing protein, partial [Lophium mytilinum]
RYIALSHCWGTSQHVTTNRETYEDRTVGIPWSSLPKTFQDAIAITRALGIQYIWIDSLAIIQGDLEDWAREASKMASIFQNCFLALGATDSAGGERGMLFSPKIHKISKTINERAFQVFVRVASNHEEVDFGLDNHPLLSRGWTFQEQLLAPRFVHFTRDSLVWECNDGLHCECCGRMLDDSSTFRDHFATMQLTLHKPGGLASPWEILRSEQPMVSNLWCNLVERYSLRKLSYDWDRLPAISSLASMFTSHLGKYLAGHWESDLPFSLLWEPRAHSGRRSRPSERPVSSPPSWSWAS